MAEIESMKRKGQSQAGIRRFSAKITSLPAAENEQGESMEREGDRERATEDGRPEAGHSREQGSSSPSSPGQKSFRHSNNSNGVMFEMLLCEMAQKLSEFWHLMVMRFDFNVMALIFIGWYVSSFQVFPLI